jgi:flagellar biosynthetic protein FlhB
MAADQDSKTEAPTPRRRNEARKKGQVARSQDLSAAIMLFAGFLALILLGPHVWLTLMAITRTALNVEEVTQGREVVILAFSIAQEALKVVVPIMLILLLAGLAVLFAQVGFLLTLDPLIPSLSKISPLNGIKRLFSFRSVAMALVNMGKLLMVALVAYLTLSGSATEILYAFTLGFSDVLRLGATLTSRLGIRLSAVLLVLALIDYAYQRYRHERDLKMTKEEVKDELRSMEGDPVVKRRRRQVQFQLALQRLEKEVPQADVVVTNPTHLAIAIRYEAEAMVAPKVIAKGADHMALRIRKLATDYGIPIVERKALARAMYEVVEVGEYIPERFYKAIAEILAYVYELSGRSVTAGAATPVPVG